MKLVILDRDGTINHDSDAYIKSPDEWQPIAGALEAICQLNRAGIKVVVATNQAAVGRGIFSIETLEAIHAKMHASALAVGAEIDAVFYCPHKPEENCECRKPRPGLLLQIAAHYRVDLARIPMVGDTLRDMQAAVAAGSPPHLVLTGKSEPLRTTLHGGSAPPTDFPAATMVHNDLHAFVQYYLRHQL